MDLFPVGLAEYLVGAAIRVRIVRDGLFQLLEHVM